MSQRQEGSGSARGELRRDLVRYLPAEGIPALISFVAIPIVTRLFDPAAYGDYRLVVATAWAFGAAGSWLAPSIYRFYPKQELIDNIENFRATVSRGLHLNLVALASAWLITVAVLWQFLRRELAVLFLIGLLLVVANQSWSVTSAQTRAMREVTWYSAVVIFNRVIALGGGVALVVLFDFGVEGLLYASIVGTVLPLPLLARVLRKRLPVGRGVVDRRLGGDMFSYGYPIAFTLVANWMLHISDRYVIGALRDTTEVGLYSAVYGISEQSIAMILMLFALPFSVLGTRVWERQGREAAANFVATSARSYFLLAIPAWAGLSVLATPIMSVMTDAPYREAAVIMPLIAGAQLLNGAYYWQKSGTNFVNQTKRQAVALIWGAAVNLILNLILVGSLGYRVAAVTTLISYAVTLFVMSRWSRQHFPWPFPWASVGRALLASVIMGGVLALLGATTDLRPIWQIATSVPMGIAIYGGLLLLLGEREAFSLLRRMTSRLPSGSG